MKVFDREQLQEGDILAGRNLDPEDRIAQGIQILLGSYTNHNALFIKKDGMFRIGDTTPPRSQVVFLSKYEQLINQGLYIVRVWRVVGMTPSIGERISKIWLEQCQEVDYPELQVLRLWTMRFLNSLPYEVKGRWCTKNTLIPFSYFPGLDPRINPDGKMKLNPTPRTMENRLVSGVLIDVTDKVLVEV